jgi:hypothetical protein
MGLLYLYLYVSDSSSVHHQEFFNVHTSMVYAIRVQDCCQLASRIRMELKFHPDPARQLASRFRMELRFHPDPARKLSANLCDIYMPETCRVSFPKINLRN